MMGNEQAVCHSQQKLRSTGIRPRNTESTQDEDEEQREHMDARIVCSMFACRTASWLRRRLLPSLQLRMEQVEWDAGQEAVVIYRSTSARWENESERTGHA